MPLSEIITSFMNSVRSFTDINKKLSLKDAQSYLDALQADLGKAKQCYEATMLNNLIITGYYYGTGNIFTNKPPAIDNKDQVRILVRSNGNNVYQLFLKDNIIWYRHYTNNIWSAWLRVGGVVKAVLSALHLERRCLA